MTPVALMVGSKRIIRANGILHPLGDPSLDSKAEEALRRAIVETALKALQTDVRSKDSSLTILKG